MKKYLIVVPSNLESSLSLLVNQKQNRGYNVIIKHVEDFANPPNTDSMRNYILNVNPEILLLVGDYDKTPGYPLSTGSNDYTSDVFYTMEDGQIVPTTPTGRLSSNNPGIIEKICKILIDYPNDPDYQWRKRVILTGWTPRGPENPHWKKDASYQDIEEIGSFFEPIMQFEYDHNHSEIRKTIWKTRNSTESSLKEVINNGALIVRYLAHGTEYGWFNIGKADNPRSDIQLTDTRNFKIGRYEEGGITKENWKLPFVISTTCLTGKIEGRSFAEEWQTHLKAIGVYAADTKSSTFWNDRITQGIFHQIVSKQKKRIGDILISAMQQLFSECDRNVEFDRRTYLMYRYLGDPDTILAVPKPIKTVLTETSEYGPELVKRENQLLLGWVGSGNHYLNFKLSSDGIHFNSKVTLGETTKNSISLVIFKNKYIVAWSGTGRGNLNIMQSEDGQNWGHKIVLTETSKSAPVLKVLPKNGGHNEMIYLAWRGNGNNKLNIIMSEDGINWHNKLTLHETTTSGPALVKLNKSKLLLGWRGVGNNSLNILKVSRDLSSWSDKVIIPETTNARPHLNNQFGRLYYAWRGMDSRLNVLQSSNGLNWIKKVTFNEMCLDGVGPSLQALDGNLVWAWTDKDGHINTSIQDWLL